MAYNNPSTFVMLFIISAILFLIGGLVFSVKVTQKALEERFEAVEKEEVEPA